MIRVQYFLPAILLLFAGVGNAQFKKGDRMAGASIASILYNSGNADISVTSIGSNKSKITNYNINILPLMGWFISENTAVGGTITLNPNGNKTTYEQNGSTYQSDKINSFNFGVGGFVRHYLHHSGSLMPFGQFSLNAGVSNLKTEGFFYGGSGANAYKTSYDGNSTGGFFVNAAFTAGLTKMVGEFTGLDLYLGYVYSYNKNTFKKTTLRDNGNDGSIDERLENETITKFTSHGFLFGVGFQVFLHKRK